MVLICWLAWFSVEAGGPFETKKRRPMEPLLYLEVVLWFLLLCFTGVSCCTAGASGLHPLS